MADSKHTSAKKSPAIDEARRRLLAKAVYAPPAIIGALALSLEGCQIASCNPTTCAPATCNPASCNPNGGPCNPTSCNPNGGPCNPNGGPCNPNGGPCNPSSCGPDICNPAP